MQTTQLPPPVQMLHLVSGFWASKVCFAIATLEIADAFKTGAQTPAQVARQTGTHAPTVHRLLRAAASFGLFDEKAGYFSITDVGRTLMTDVPGSLRDFAMAELGQEHYEGWGNLLHSVRTGDIAFNHATGRDVWAYYADHPEDGQRFTRAMANMSNGFNPAIVHGYDFSEFSSIVDVGGGSGALLCGILHHNPDATGIVFDLPYVFDQATTYIREEGLTDRCQPEAGDFFVAVPEGADAYLLKVVIHDWNDASALKILQSCHRAMPDHAKLLLIESVIPPGNDPHFGKLLDINMLVMTGGMERDEAQYTQLLADAGFDVQRILPTRSPLNIIECVKSGHM